jgi:AraC family transcriptional regulator
MAKTLLAGNYSGKIIRGFHKEGLMINAIAYSPENCDTSFHAHFNPHISFVLRGGSREKRGQTSYERRPGNIHFYDEGEIHQTIPATLSTHINLELEASFLANYDISLKCIQEAVALHTDIQFVMLKMSKELFNFSGHISPFVQLLLSVMPENSIEQKRNIPSWVPVVKAILNDRWNEYPTLNDLATATSVHPVTISKYFRRYFFCTLGEYIRKLKISKSIILLQEPGRSLTEIAYCCGFADQSHFIRNFKACTGLLPKEARQL